MSKEKSLKNPKILVSVIVVVVLILVLAGIFVYHHMIRGSHGASSQPSTPASASVDTTQQDPQDPQPKDDDKQAATDPNKAIPLLQSDIQPKLSLKKEVDIKAESIEMSEVTLKFKHRRDFGDFDGKPDYDNPQRGSLIVFDVDVTNKTDKPLPTLPIKATVLRYDEATPHWQNAYRYFDGEYLPYSTEIPAGKTVRKVFVFPMFSVALDDERNVLILDDNVDPAKGQQIPLSDL